AIGGIAGAFLAKSGALRYFERIHSPLGPLPVLGVEALVLWAVISIHEAGHLVSAMAVGFRGLLYVSGPLHFYREDTGWRLRLNRNPALYGGIVSALPVSLDRLRERLLVMVAGGPTASILSGFIMMAVASIAPPNSLARAIMSSYAFVSVAIGVVTLVPARTIGFLTDGGQLLRLIRGGDAVERDNAVLFLVAASYAGIRPRDWDRDVLAVVTRTSDDVREQLTAARYAFMHALDVNDIDSARRCLNELIPNVELLPRPIHATTLISAAYFVAHYDGDVTRASEYLTRARQVWKMPANATTIADAAIALASGHPERVEALVAEAETVMAHGIDRGNIAVARDMIASLRTARDKSSP
ncbi:MAG TPA: M50 family metallopeptidase, partial [Gemmatimonadaceae bacterium]